LGFVCFVFELVEVAKLLVAQQVAEPVALAELLDNKLW
jgi:hypothetical protein